MVQSPKAPRYPKRSSRLGSDGLQEIEIETLKSELEMAQIQLTLKTLHSQGARKMKGMPFEMFPRSETITKLREYSARLNSDENLAAHNSRDGSYMKLISQKSGEVTSYFVLSEVDSIDELEPSKITGLWWDATLCTPDKVETLFPTDGSLSLSSADLRDTSSSFVKLQIGNENSIEGIMDHRIDIEKGAEFRIRSKAASDGSFELDKWVKGSAVPSQLKLCDYLMKALASMDQESSA